MATRKTRAKKVISKKASTSGDAAVDRRVYDLAVVVSPTVKADQRSTIIESLKKTVEKAKGMVDRVDEMGLRDLAYPIRSERTGWYAILTASLPPIAVSSIDETIRRDEKILRHLLTRAT